MPRNYFIVLWHPFFVVNKRVRERYCLSVLNKNQRDISFWDKVCLKYGKNLSKQENSLDTVFEFTV